MTRIPTNPADLYRPIALRPEADLRSIPGYGVRAEGNSRAGRERARQALGDSHFAHDSRAQIDILTDFAADVSRDPAATPSERAVTQAALNVVRVAERDLHPICSFDAQRAAAATAMCVSSLQTCAQVLARFPLGASPAAAIGLVGAQIGRGGMAVPLDAPDMCYVGLGFLHQAAETVPASSIAEDAIRHYNVERGEDGSDKAPACARIVWSALNDLATLDPQPWACHLNEVQNATS